MFRHQPKKVLKSSPTNLQEMYEFFRRFKLTDSLIHVAHINAILKWGDEKKYVKHIPQPTLSWVEWYQRTYPHDHFLSLAITRLARFLILAGGNDDRSAVLTPGQPYFNTALNFVNNVSELDEGENFITDISSMRIFGRVFATQFPLQFNEIDLIGRSYLLFIEIASDSSNYHISERFQQYFDLTPLEFLAAGFAIWALSDGTFGDQPYFIEKEISKILSTAKLRTALLLCSGTVTDYRKNLRGSDWKTINRTKDCFGLDPFYTIPALKSGRIINGENIFIIPSLKHLLMRASSGVFYLLADKERDSNLPGSKKNAFRVAFGDIYRKYVSRLVNVRPYDNLLVDLDEDFDYPNASKPDFAIISGNLCLLLEVKTSILTVEARMYFNEVKLRDEVAKGGMNVAIGQLQTFISKFQEGKILDDRFKRVDRIIPMIIGFEDIFVLNSTLLPLIDEKNFPQMTDLQLATITDVDAIGDAMAQGYEVNKIIAEKVDSHEHRSWSIAQYIINQGVKRDAHPLIREAFENFTQRILPTDRIV